MYTWPQCRKIAQHRKPEGLDDSEKLVTQTAYKGKTTLKKFSSNTN